MLFAAPASSDASLRNTPLADWITDALPLAVAAGSRVGPPVSPPEGAYPNSNRGLRTAISTESTAGFGRSATVNPAHRASQVAQTGWIGGWSLVDPSATASLLHRSHSE
jgi:hypothetical protein